MKPDTRNPGRRGVALLVALGVLVVLALLGSVFATLSGIERAVARNYVDKVRARLLAESGIEHAVSQLWQPDKIDMWRVDRPLAWTFFGGDRNGDGIRDAGDLDKNGDGFPDREDVSVTEALSPSFFIDENNDGLADQVTVGDRTIGYSGKAAVGTYRPDGNLYSIRIRDLASKVNVNNVHPNMTRLLTNLFTAINLPNAAVEADKIVRGRPVQGYTDPNHLRAVVGKTTYDRIKSYVTTVGWVDPREVTEPRRIVRPVPLGNGYRRRNLAIGTDVYARWELRPTLKYDAATDGPAVHSPRTPVNINEAPIEVLVALIQDLKGFYVYEDKYTTHTYDWYGLTAKYDGSMPNMPSPRVIRNSKVGHINGRVGTIYETTPIPAGTKPTAGSFSGVNGDGAWGIAKAIVDERNLPFVAPPGFTFSGVSPRAKNLFRNFQQFNRFVDELDPKLFRPVPGWDQPRWALPLPESLAGLIGRPANEIPMVKDVLKANFNPNAHFSSLNPNELLGVWIDKANLTFHTIEFAFHPMGFFEIQSAGWVIDDQRRVVAEEIVTTAVKLFESYRDTTQWDFMREFSVDGVGLGNVFSNASGTPGSVSLCSYPEFQAADYLRDPNMSLEGYLALNTVKSMDGGGTTLALRYDNEGATAGDERVFYSAEGWPFLRDTTTTPFTAAFGQGGPWADRLIGGPTPGSAVNDGLLCEVGSAPGYANSRFSQHRGTVSMWVKPAFQPENTGRQRIFLSSHYYQWPGDRACGSGHLAQLHNFPSPEWLMSPFGIYYTAQHTDGPYATDASLVGTPVNNYAETRSSVVYNQFGTTWPERSLGAGFGGRWCMDEFNGGIISPTINHVGHSHDPADSVHRFGNIAMSKRWMHVCYIWNDKLDIERGFCRLYLNGKCVGGQLDGTYRFSAGMSYSWDKGSPHDPADSLGAGPNTRWGKPLDPLVTGEAMDRVKQFAQDHVTDNAATPEDEKQKYINEHLIEEIKGPSAPLLRIGAEANPPVPGLTLEATIPAGSLMSNGARRPICNYTADATIDDVLVWQEVNDAVAGAAWLQGRYYKENGAAYTSPKIDLFSQPTRSVAPKGNAPLPGPVTSIPAPPPPEPPTTRMAFVSVTGYWPVNPVRAVANPDDPYDPDEQDLSKTMFSIAVVDPNTPSTELMPMQKLPLGGTGVTDNANYSADPAANPGKPVEIVGSRFRYKIVMDSNFEDRLNRPLLVTPILDDVTVAYYNRLPAFQAWVVGEE
jgi:hypothetical protein